MIRPPAPPPVTLTVLGGDGEDRDFETARLGHLECAFTHWGVLRLRIECDSRFFCIGCELIDVLRCFDEDPHADALLTVATFFPVILTDIDRRLSSAHR